MKVADDLYDALVALGWAPPPEAEESPLGPLCKTCRGSGWSKRGFVTPAQRAFGARSHESIVCPTCEGGGLVR